MFNLGKVPLLIRQQRKINTLMNEVESLKNIIKDGLYKELIKTIDQSFELQRLKEEHKKLKIKYKELKEKYGSNN